MIELFILIYCIFFSMLYGIYRYPKYQSKYFNKLNAPLWFVVIGAFLFILAIGSVIHDKFLTGPHPPKADYGLCVKSHVETSIVPIVTTDGNGNMSTSLYPSDEDVCDLYQYPDGVSPEYKIKYNKYLVERQKWEKLHAQ